MTTMKLRERPSAGRLRGTPDRSTDGRCADWEQKHSATEPHWQPEFVT